MGGLKAQARFRRFWASRLIPEPLLALAVDVGRLHLLFRLDRLRGLCRCFLVAEFSIRFGVHRILSANLDINRQMR